MESEAHPDGGVFPRGVFSRDDGLVLFVDKPDFAIFIRIIRVIGVVGIVGVV